MNNFLKKVCNFVQREYINKIFEDLKFFGNLKLFWSFVLFVCKGLNEFIVLKVDDVIQMDDLEIVESMNFYFLIVFILEDYGNFFEYSNFVDFKLLIIFCIINKVFCFLRNFNLYKFLGFDYFLLIEIVLIFCLFLNRFFFVGEVLYVWKIVNIVFVYKKGRKDCRENYC